MQQAEAYFHISGEIYGLERIVRSIEATPDVEPPTRLRGSPPMAVCTICAGKKEIGWENHYGIVRALDSDLFYRGQ
jgi:hypothetical protein